jgi:UDP-N-acetylglucosamine acyltransferase
LSAGTRVDPRACVDPRAELGVAVEVGPFAVVGPGVQVGDGTSIGAHATVLGPSRIGAGCRIHAHAVLGGPPQDLRHRGEPTTLHVGERTEVREFATLNRGTARDRGDTSVGARVLVMAYAHVAHDCVVDDDVVLANGAMLAGHVRIGRHAILGGLCAVGQHLRVGESAFVAAGAMVERDVPPFHVVGGDRARVRGINRVGLARRGFPPSVLAALRRAHRLLVRSRDPLDRRLAATRESLGSVPEVQRLLEFYESSERGVCR